MILPEYQDVKIENKDLLILEIDSTVSSLVLPTLDGRNLETEYLKAFQKSFENGIAQASSFLTVFTGKLNKPDLLKQQEKVLPSGDKINLLMPETNSLITDKVGHIPDYILIISDMELIPVWVEERLAPYETGYRQSICYVIWDNYQNKSVCYGESVVSSRGFSLRFDSISTQYFIRQNARVIIANSPFKRR